MELFCKLYITIAEGLPKALRKDQFR